MSEHPGRVALSDFEGVASDPLSEGVLFDTLEEFEQRDLPPAVADAAASGDAASAAGDEPEAQASTQATPEDEQEAIEAEYEAEREQTEHVSVPFNEFPPGF